MRIDRSPATGRQTNTDVENSATSTRFGASLGGRAAPPVSVGLPVHNGSRYLQRALDTILAQTDVDFELVIADNCSSDATQDMCLDVARRDARVRYLRRDRNIGPNSNHNRLVHETTGTFFQWAACDDEYRPTRTARLLDALDGAPDAVLALSSAVQIDEHGDPVRSWYNDCRTDLADPVARMRDFVSRHPTTLHMYGLVRRSVLLRTGLFPPVHQGDRVWLAELPVPLK